MNIWLEDELYSTHSTEICYSDIYALRPQDFEPPSPVTSTDSSSMASSDSDFAPPSALKVTETSSAHTNQNEPTIDEHGIPILKTCSAVSIDDRAQALKIVADSVAQQRNVASRALVYHPITLALLVAGFAGIRQAFYDGRNSDYIKILITFVGFVMSLLTGFRYVCAPYIAEAERIGTWKWLNEGRSAAEEEETGMHVVGEQDEILLTKFGPDYIGAIIFRGVQPLTGAKKSKKPTKMQIRAWTVAQKYRRKDVGTALLEDAIKIGAQQGWTTGGVEIAPNHANSKRVLPQMLNGALDKYDEVAHKVLSRKLGDLTDKRRK